MKNNRYMPLVLTILFGPLGWLYNLRRNSFKAAIVLGGMANILVLLWLIIATREAETFPYGNPDSYDILFVFLAFFGVVVSWSLAIIDSIIALKNASLNGNGINKTRALVIACCLGAWTWLYTYQKDWKKLISGLLLSYGAFAVRVLFDEPYFLIIVVAIWLISIADVLLRNSESYQVAG